MATKAARKTKPKGAPAKRPVQTTFDDLYTEEGVTGRGAEEASAAARETGVAPPEAGVPGQADSEAAAGSGREPGSASTTGESEPPPGPAAAAPAETVPADTLEERHLRLRAEFDNYIKRTGREKSELTAYGGIAMVRALLPVLDDLKRTVAHAQEAHHDSADPLLQGVVMVLEKFTRLLEAEGVRPIEALGKPFDPLLHEALLRRESADHPEGMVLEEFETGYLYRDRVIRHAKVVVSG